MGTWDFVAGNASVDEDHPHGMNCLSTIAANMPGVFMGTAPKASFIYTVPKMQQQNIPLKNRTG